MIEKEDFEKMQEKAMFEALVRTYCRLFEKSLKEINIKSDFWEKMDGYLKGDKETK